MQKTYALGKLPSEHLARLLGRHGSNDPRVVLGPGIGHDAAVISFGERCLVAKTDPITFAADEIGWYAVHVNANDIACTGGTPRWFLATLLLPEGDANGPMVDAIFDQIDRATSDVGATLVGGHTEITHDIDRPIVVGCMLGEVEAGRLVRPEGALPGDAIIVTKGIAIEGTAIIARELGDRLDQLDRAVVNRSKRFLRDPGISVVCDAATALAAGSVHAFHDPTEGGLATGLWELAEAADVGLVIEDGRIPIYPETRVMCELLGLDPLGLIASGALLMVVAPGDALGILSTLAREGIAAATIGRVIEGPGQVIIRDATGERPLRRFARDEIARLFE